MAKLRNLMLSGLAGLVLAACGPEKPNTPTPGPSDTNTAPSIQLSLEEATAGLAPAAEYTQGSSLQASASATDAEDNLASLNLYLDGTELESGVDSVQALIDTGDLSLERHIVSATATDAQGLEASTEQAFTLTETGVTDINNAPSLSMSLPATAAQGTLVTADLCDSTDPDGDALTYSVNWGDGDTSSGSNCSPTHTYSSADTFSVVGTVSDGELSDTVAKSITIEPVMIGEAPSVDWWFVQGSYAEGFKTLSLQLILSDDSTTVANLRKDVIDENIEGSGPQIGFNGGLSTSYDLTLTNPEASYTIELEDDDGNISQYQINAPIDRTWYHMNLVLDNGTEVTAAVPQSIADKLGANLLSYDSDTNGIYQNDRLTEPAAVEAFRQAYLNLSTDEKELIKHWGWSNWPNQPWDIPTQTIDTTLIDQVNYSMSVTQIDDGVGEDIDIVQILVGQDPYN